jgi:3-oxoisoapionate kinase
MLRSSHNAPALILTFYGDDFTGSTDSLEAVAMAGIPAMLFLAPPSATDLARHPELRAVGVAGTSRSRSPEWMDQHLPPVFQALRALGAPLCHYKTCSTFDSAPHVGNIGRAAEIGQDVFGTPVLTVVGVTRHKRFVVFSNLFAAGSISDTQDIFRIDRHPTMSRHPSTPMAEADLRLHLAKQTSRRIAGFDFRRMLADDAAQALTATLADNDIVILDTFDAATTRVTGRLIAELAARQPIFVVGSSGVEYALADHLTASGVLPIAPPPTSRGAVDKLIAVCGSCSPVTDSQIAWAEQQGLAVVGLDTVAAVEHADTVEAKVAETIAKALSNCAGVVLHTARGPSDPRLQPTLAALARQGLSAADSSRVLGTSLGRALRTAVAKTGVRRAVLAGGDSTSHAVSAMGVDSLDVAGPLVPGAPLCRIHSRDAAIDGLEISLKGGQVGAPDYFARVFAGH